MGPIAHGADIVDRDAVADARSVDRTGTAEDVFGAPDSPSIAREAQAIFKSKVPVWVKIVVPVALFIIIVVSCALGSYGISPLDLLQTLYWHYVDPSKITDPNFERVLFKLRLPRIGLVLLCGAALAVAGASYQGMFKNPLVSPDLLGASAGASLGACFALLFNMPNVMVQVFAFFGGLIAVGAAVALTRMVKYDAILGLVLGGILVSSLFQSGMSIIKLVADGDDKLPAITFWLMGSFAGGNSDDLLLILLPMLIGFVLLLTQRWRLNVLSFGDEEARSMGINTRRTRLLVILASTLLTSCTVAVAGIIGWIGLVIPHLARAIVGPNYRVLLPTSMLIGAGYLLVVDDLARMLTTIEIPIGILTAVLGVPFFIFIYMRNMRGWQ